jgi:hypothetical protein
VQIRRKSKKPALVLHIVLHGLEVLKFKGSGPGRKSEIFCSAQGLVVKLRFTARPCNLVVPQWRSPRNDPVTMQPGISRPSGVGQGVLGEVEQISMK